MKDMRGLVVGVCTLVEVGCILGLARIANKRNRDAYNAEMECLNKEVELSLAECSNAIKDYKIALLEKEIKELKNEVEEEES